MNALYSIASSYFCAGVIVNDGVIVQAAPILKWSIGWSFEEFRKYCQRKRWAILS